MQDYRKKLMNPFSAASRGIEDDVVAPESLRKELIRSLDMIAEKPESLPLKKQGNIPI
jgi:acetyl-CoA carboxylase carboxyltransferase component